MSPGKISLLISIILHIIAGLFFYFTTINGDASEDTYLYLDIDIETIEVPVVEEQNEPEEISNIPPTPRRITPTIQENIQKEESISSDLPMFLLKKPDSTDTSIDIVAEIEKYYGMNTGLNRLDVEDLLDKYKYIPDSVILTKQDTLNMIFRRLDSLVSNLNFSTLRTPGMDRAVEEYTSKYRAQTAPIGLLLIGGAKVVSEIFKKFQGEESPAAVNSSMNYDEIAVMNVLWEFGELNATDIYSNLGLGLHVTFAKTQEIIFGLLAKNLIIQKNGRFIEKRFFFDPKGVFEILYSSAVTREGILEYYNEQAGKFTLNIEAGKVDSSYTNLVEEIRRKIQILKDK